MTDEREHLAEVANGVDKSAKNVEASAAKVESASDRLLRLVKVLLFLAFLKIMIIAGLAVLIQKNNENNEETQKIVADVRVSVRHLEDFVDELQAPDSPDVQARNAAITEAVQRVPEIKDILCEQFPEATACQTGG